MNIEKCLQAYDRVCHSNAIAMHCSMYEPAWRNAHYHASPHPSSSSSFAFGSSFLTSFFGGTTTFLVVVADPVVLARPPTAGRTDLVAVVEVLVSPLGSGFFVGFLAPD
jgi:hypothetical protein